jgi:hypothetical protein
MESTDEVVALAYCDGTEIEAKWKWTRQKIIVEADRYGCQWVSSAERHVKVEGEFQIVHTKRKCSSAAHELAQFATQDADKPAEKYC